MNGSRPPISAVRSKVSGRLMRILVINPNTTSSMTRKIAEAARLVAPPDVEIVARNPNSGPEAIQGREDGEAALPGTLAEVEKGRDERFDATILACFDDTGLDEARAISGMPTLGIGQAAFHAAMLIGKKFSVVTTLSVSVPVICKNLDSYGLAGSCIRVRASEVPVLDLERSDSDARRRVAAEIELALHEDQPGAIVLGCAGMTDLTTDLARRFNIPVIDGVVAAVGFAVGLVRMTV